MEENKSISFVEEPAYKKYCRDNRDIVYEIEKRYRQSIIDEKKYYCAVHDKAFWNPTWYKNHMNCSLHKPKVYVIYECTLCNYASKNKYAYNRHLKAKKHIRNELSAKHDQSIKT